jgi:hypothetical protein
MSARDKLTTLILGKTAPRAADAILAAGYGDVREQQAALERVEALAALWEARGESDMAYSKTIPDEDIAMALLTSGAGMVENARHIRIALDTRAERP